MIGIGNVIYFDVFEDLFVAVQSIDANDFSYTVRQLDGTIVSELDVACGQQLFGMGCSDD